MSWLIRRLFTGLHVAAGASAVAPTGAKGQEATVTARALAQALLAGAPLPGLHAKPWAWKAGQMRVELGVPLARLLSSSSAVSTSVTVVGQAELVPEPPTEMRDQFTSSCRVRSSPLAEP